MIHILMQKSKFYINTLGYTMFIVFYNFCLVINIFNNLDDLVLKMFNKIGHEELWMF